MKHFLSIEAVSRAQIEGLLDDAVQFKKGRGHHGAAQLQGQCWALIFSKSSTRTRVSFEVGIRELGGESLFLAAADIQLGRGEPIKDTARVLGRMVHGAIIRTFDQKEVEDFAEFSGIPTINALTDEEHPCQIIADLLTIQEKLGSVAGRKVAFIGDGDCNVARSWVWAAARMGLNLHIAAPARYQPSADFLARVGTQHVTVTADLAAAVEDADVLYTDVWVSMGKEEESDYRTAQLAGYQINEALVRRAAPGALVMHCLPAYRGKEIDDATMEAHAQTIFDQAENRLHAQKAILAALARR